MKIKIITMLFVSLNVSTAMAADSVVPNAVDRIKAEHAHTQQASSHWTAYPVIEENRFSSRKRAVFEVRNLEAEAAQIFPPTGTGNFPDQFAIKGDAKSYQEQLKKGRFAITPKGRGNYYWVMATDEKANHIYSANSVRYFTAPGPAPTEMLAVAKSRLQITPDPLPREHWRYREGETWQFKLRFDDKALANKLIKLETERGTKQVFESDHKGVVHVVFPKDIGDAKHEKATAHHGQPKSQFVLAVEHSEADKLYHTTFNYQYAASAMREKSITAGVGFMALGGLLALPLLRRPKSEKKRGRHV